MKTLKFLVTVFAFVFTSIYLIYIGFIYFNQTELIFHAVKLNPNYKFDYVSDFKEFMICTSDNKKLNGLLFTSKNSKGLVFYLHGNAGNLSKWGSIAGVYNDLGYDIFILDYRGFGKSEGSIGSEVQFNDDVYNAYRKMCTLYKESDIVIMGYSIGTGAATILAANQHPKLLVLQSPYYSFDELSSSKVPFFPRYLKKFRFDTYAYIPLVKVPIYIFHGKDDQLILCENSIRLSKLLKPNDSLFELVNQGHIGMNENLEFQQELKQILE